MSHTDKKVPAGQSPSASLALRPREAARELGISERLLWKWTRSEGVPHVRIGGVVLYPVAGLQRWLDERSVPSRAGARPPT